jgi:NADH-quinone oxidoreductase subunit N
LENIADLSGLSRNCPKLAAIFAILFMSLAGVPPLAGFLAKWYVFAAAMQAGLVVPAVIGVLASVIALVYYLRVLKIMYFDEPVAAFDENAGFGIKATLLVSGVVALGFIVAASPVINAADAAAKALLP